jgi:hypothetical protein
MGKWYCSAASWAVPEACCISYHCTLSSLSAAGLCSLHSFYSSFFRTCHLSLRHLSVITEWTFKQHKISELSLFFIPDRICYLHVINKHYTFFSYMKWFMTEINEG